MRANYNEKNNPIVKYRREKNISQEELASKLEISRTSLGRYENGEPIPSNILILLAKELKVSSDYLIGLSNNKNPKYEKLWEEFALDYECIEKMKLIANLTAKRNDTQAIDTINYLFKYSNIELIEYLGEYLNIPLPEEINYKIDRKITPREKAQLIQLRKKDIEEAIIFKELSRLFDQIKSSPEVKEKYKKSKKMIELDRPINRATDEQLVKLEIKQDDLQNE